MVVDCETAFERLLEADPGELTGQNDSELAVHMRACVRCRAVAERILAAQDRLAAALDELHPLTEVGVAVRQVRERRQAALRRERAWRWGPVAAAAVIAVAMVLKSLPAGRLTVAEVEAVPAEVEILVEAATSQNVMVFETRDRSAKVVWFY